MATQHRLRHLSTVAYVALAILLPAIPSEAVQTPQSVVVSADPVNWTPNIQDGQVNAILQMGSKVIVGGTFTTVRRADTQTDLTRNYIFAFDMNTGAIDPNFVPQLPSEVETLAAGPDGQSVFVGGTFNAVNGNTNYRRLVRLSLATGQIVTGFQANAGSAVLDLVLRGPWLYVAGQFTSNGNAAGRARTRETSTPVQSTRTSTCRSAPRSWGVAQRPQDRRHAGRLQARRYRQLQSGGRTPARSDGDDRPVHHPGLGVVVADQHDPVRQSGDPTQTWCSSSFATWMRDIDISPDGSYWVLVTTGAYRANRCATP